MIRLNRLRVLMDLKNGRRDIPRKRVTGFTWAMVEWFEKHGLVHREVDKIGLDGRAITLRRVVLTPNGITSLRKAVEEHERHHSFSQAAREKP